MFYLIASFFAGFLTVLAPCVLTLLPVILGGSVISKNKLRPLVITLSLGVSVILFSLILKGSTLFIDIPNTFWKLISGGVIISFGLILFFPKIWDKISIKFGFYKSEALIEKSENKGGYFGMILLGAALGPVFTTCSPTYSLIIATLLPLSFWNGFLNLISYSIGLMIPLIAIGYGGRKVVSKFKFAANPNGYFKKILALILLIVGFSIIIGLDKKLESKILDSGYFGPIKIENSILQKIK